MGGALTMRGLVLTMVLKLNKYTGTVHYNSMITGFGHQIVYSSGCNHSRSDVGQNISGVTENVILWTPLLMTFMQMDMVRP